MTANKPEPIAWGIDPCKMSEADLLPCPACGSRAGKATKRAAKGLPFVGLWKVSCQRPECPLAMIYFHPVEWNQLPRIKQSEYDALQAEREKLRKDAERIEWLEDQTKKSRTGISFDYQRYAEDGYVVEHGYRFMRRYFVSGFKDSLRAAIDAAMQETNNDNQ